MGRLFDDDYKGTRSPEYTTHRPGGPDIPATPADAPRDTSPPTEEPPRTALEDCVGALQFVLAFYEPGQRYLDGEAWKVACANAVAAYNRGATELGWNFYPLNANSGSVYR